MPSPHRCATTGRNPAVWGGSLIPAAPSLFAGEEARQLIGDRGLDPDLQFHLALLDSDMGEGYLTGADVAKIVRAGQVGS